MYLFVHFWTIYRVSWSDLSIWFAVHIPDSSLSQIKPLRSFGKTEGERLLKALLSQPRLWLAFAASVWACKLNFNFSSFIRPRSPWTWLLTKGCLVLSSDSIEYWCLDFFFSQMDYFLFLNIELQLQVSAQKIIKYKSAWMVYLLSGLLTEPINFKTSA